MALIRKTILWICLMSCIGLSSELFVSKGRFEPCPEGINDDECGRRVTTKIINLQFKEHCYLRNYGNKTVFVSEGTSTPAYPSKGELRTNRVAFGVRAEDTEAPWAVYIRFYFGVVPLGNCSGSLIALKWVLTAAHCLIHRRLTYTSAVIYAGNVGKGLGQTRRSPAWKWFPNYEYRPDDDERTDIALMKLDEPFTRITRDRYYLLNTVCLPNPGQLNDEGDIAAFFGFGLLEGDVETEWLMKALFWLSPYTQCTDYGTLCANLTGRPGTPARACEGDSGGGLVQYDEHWTRGIVAGVYVGADVHVADAVPQCGTNIWYNYFVPVGQWTNFIMDTLACEP